MININTYELRLTIEELKLAVHISSAKCILMSIAMNKSINPSRFKFKTGN